jgi:hypothetical protein
MNGYAAFIIYITARARMNLLFQYNLSNLIKNYVLLYKNYISLLILFKKFSLPENIIPSSPAVCIMNTALL